jgi:hypothetical protein
VSRSSVTPCVCEQHALRSFVYTTAKSMLSFVTKESPIEPRTASFLDEIPRHRSPASPTLSHASILSPGSRLNSHPPSSPLEPTPTALPLYSPAAHPPPPAASPAAAVGGARAALFAAEPAEPEPAHPRQHSAGEGGGAARTEPAHAAATPETQASGSAPLGLYWPAPTTPRRAADGVGRLDTLQEAEGSEDSPELSPQSARVSSVIQWDEEEDDDDPGPGPPVSFAAMAFLRASVAEGAMRVDAERGDAYCAANGPLLAPALFPDSAHPRMA